MNKVERLLAPRWKVIQDFPFNTFYKVGGIIIDDGVNVSRNENGIPVYDCEWDNFPAIFKKLEWWEERTVEEMPEYVKVIAEDIAKRTGLFCKVTEWDKYPDNGNKWGNEGDWGVVLENYLPEYEKRFREKTLVHVTHFTPCSELEYTTYLSSLNIKQ